MKLPIKGMYTLSCKNTARAVVEELGLHVVKVNLSELVTEENITKEQREKIRSGLKKYELELLDDPMTIMIEKIKDAIIWRIYFSKEPIEQNYSDYLADIVCQDYTYLATCFHNETGYTIEQIIIYHRIERVKELLDLGVLNLTQIAHLLGFSSVQHLSAQFKKVTKMTPSDYKTLKNKRRHSLCNE